LGSAVVVGSGAGLGRLRADGGGWRAEQAENSTRQMSHAQAVRRAAAPRPSGMSRDYAGIDPVVAVRPRLGRLAGGVLIPSPPESRPP